MSSHLLSRTPLAIALCLAIAGPALAEPLADAAAATVQPDGADRERVYHDLDTIRVDGKRERGYGAERSSTGTRTDTPLVDVPQAVSVVSQGQIRDQAIQSMADAVRYVPGIGATQGEGNRDGLVFRGNSSTADLFIDGMRDDVQYYRDTYNIERIEAFKGPNAMIFGRGSPGGLLNRVTKVADWTTRRELGLQAGSWDKRRLTADVGQAIGDGTAFRVTGVYEDSDSYRDGVTLERKGVNPTFAIRIGDATRITLGYEYFKDARTADRGVPSDSVASGGTRHPVATDAATFFGDPDRSPTWAEVNAFNALVEHDFGDGKVLRNRTRYADYDKFYQNVFPGSVNAAGTTVAIAAYNNATQRRNLFNQTDFVFSADTGDIAHKILVGAEFGRQDTDNLRKTGRFTLPDPTCLAGSSATSCIVDLAAPTISVPVTFANNGTSDAFNSGVNKFAAVYAQDQIEFSEHWQAVIGLRYDRFDVDFTDRRAATAPANRRLSSSDDLLSPRAGLIWKPVKNASIYASYGITYLPRSGEQLSSLTPNAQSLDPEEFRNYEIGAKWDLRPDLSASLAVYRLDRSNASVVDPADPTRLVLLDGDSQRIEGAELSLAGNLTRQWQIIASYAYQDARTVRAVGTTPAGRTLAQSPEHSISVWNRYDFSPKWGAGLGAIHRSDSYASISNAVTLEGYTRFDAAVFYRINDNLRAQLNVENLFDTDYFPTAHSDSNISPGAPRGAYLSVNFTF